MESGRDPPEVHAALPTDGTHSVIYSTVPENRVSATVGAMTALSSIPPGHRPGRARPVDCPPGHLRRPE